MNRLIAFFFTVSFLTTFGQANVTDKQGRKQGEWGKTYPGTSVYIYKGQFKDDKPIGKFVYYYKSSRTKAVIKHQENSNRSVAYFYHENGKMMSHGIYRDMKKDSVWVQFTTLSQLSSVETYKNGELHGKRTVYYLPEKLSDKSQRPSRIEYYKNGVLEGEVTEYFLNRKVKQRGKYQNGKKVGFWEDFHTNGKKMTTQYFRNGIRHGWAYTYDEKGMQESKNYFYFGKVLKGDKLKEKMQYLKEKGINPNG